MQPETQALSVTICPMPEERSSNLSTGLHVVSVLPDGEPRATLGVIHGYGDHAGRHLPVMRFLAGHGIATHAVDLRGQGKSPGRRGYVRRWADYLDDLDAFLASPQMSAGCRFLLGHSHGGLIVAAAGIEGRLGDVTGCVFTSPFLKSRLKIPAHKRLLARLANPIVPWLPVGSGLSDGMMTSDEAMLAESREDPLITRVATPRWFAGMREAQKRVMGRAGDFRLPMLMLTGSVDPIADTSAAAEFVARAGSADKTAIEYSGMLHEILRERERWRVFEDVLTWITTRARDGF